MRAPLLFLVFNRPEPTARVFAAIRAARPPRLYVAADGPRLERPSEPQLCEQTRRIATAVDWDCDVKPLFRESNLGCKQAVSQAIDWFFAQETEGVILEDDCLPDPSFFRFCDELLERYRHDEMVGFITGDNFQAGTTHGDSSYYFSQYPHIWGWASWRRTWSLYDRDVTQWPRFRDTGGLRRALRRRSREIRFWTGVFNRLHAGGIETWDYQVTLMALMHGLATVIPQRNLVSNIGFGADATHTTNVGAYSNLAVSEMPFPLRHPGSPEVCVEADRLLAASMYRVPPLHRLKSMIRRLAGARA